MPEKLSFRFLRQERLRRPTDFKLVYDRRRSVADEWLLVYVRENGLPHLRLGLSVSRKFGPAVRRNRIRRLYREAFRLTKNDMPPGLDLVLIPRQSELPTLDKLKESLVRLVQMGARKLGL